MRRRAFLVGGACAALLGLSREASARRRGRVDVDFKDADLVAVLTMLAETAKLGLVVGEGVGGKVTAKLRSVDPIDAMSAIAAAHGAEIELRGKIAIVTGVRAR